MFKNRIFTVSVLLFMLLFIGILGTFVDQASAIELVPNNDDLAVLDRVAPKITEPMVNECQQIFYQDFERNLGGFSARGTAAVSRSNEQVREDSLYSLKISERGSDNWHGAQVNLTRLMATNGEYAFEAYVYGEVAAQYIMSLHVTGEGVNPEGGNDHFPWIGQATIEGEWTMLSGTFTAPGNFDSIFLNFETNADGIRPDIYVDYVKIYALEGTDLPDFQDGFDPELPALKHVWEDYFLIGNIYSPDIQLDRRKDLLLHHFNLITAENIMKPGAMQPAPGTFAFDLADEMMDFAVQNQLAVIGHTLVWHQQSIDWIDEANTSREEAIGIMKNHIETVMRHYMERNPNQIMAWDVVNEAIIEDNAQDPANWRANLRDTKWLRLIGPDYIQIAFEHAREVNPNAILYYNDYNLNHIRKATSVYHMVAELRELGVPIDRIGMQGHYNTRTPISSVRHSLELFSQIEGIKVSFTELDVTIVGGEQASAMTAEDGILQGQVYAQLFQLFREFSDVVERVTFWGLDDANSWRADRLPTLFNENLSAKPAFFGVMDPDGFLEEHPLPELSEPETAYATYGTPVIGQFNEALWAKADPIPVTHQLTAWEGATASAKVLWDETHIYVLMDVQDPILNDDALEVHNQDSVEVFLSQNNTRSPFYLAGDYQLRVSFRNHQSFGSGGPVSGFESASELTATGYRVELKIPLESPAYDGRILGFDLQVNDANGQGVRQSVAKWNDLTDLSWQSTENWGLLQLVGELTN